MASTKSEGEAFLPFLDLVAEFLNATDAVSVLHVCRSWSRVVGRLPWGRVEGSARVAEKLSNMIAWTPRGTRYDYFVSGPGELVSALSNLEDLDLRTYEMDPAPQSPPLANLTKLKKLNIERVEWVCDGDLIPLWKLQSLDMRWCRSLSDAAFANLRGLTSLYMSECRQTTISDAAFVGLSQLRVLHISSCPQTTITDAAFRDLTQLETLAMCWCNQTTITDEAFKPLPKLKDLTVYNCNQSTITDGAFQYWTGLTSLELSGCNQRSITDAGFEHLTGLQRLSMAECRQSTITDAALAHLTGLQRLDMSGCRQLRTAEARRLAGGIPEVLWP